MNFNSRRLASLETRVCVALPLQAELGRLDIRKMVRIHYQDEADRLQRELEAACNMQGERDHADDSRDKFKEKYGQAQTAYEKSDAQVKAYQQQGHLGSGVRILSRNYENTTA